MKMVKSLLLGSAAGLVAVAGAQAADLPVKAKAVEYVKVCSLYGAGFYYIPGTDTCIKIGGYVRFEAYHNNLGAHMPYFGSTEAAYTRHTDTHSTRARGMFSMDVRSQTEYGTLRSYMRFGQQNTADPGGAVAKAINMERAFIQFAGFTFGLSDSYFDFYNGAAYGFTPQFANSAVGPAGINVAAYTAQFGNGVSASLSLEDRRLRDKGVVDMAAGTTVLGLFGAGFSANTSDSAGTRIPDIVGNIRVDQAWGSAQIMGALHEVRARYYNGAIGTNCTAAVGGLNQNACGAPGDEWGWAVGAGLTLKMPWDPKDTLSFQVAYTEGAVAYAGQGLTNAYIHKSGGLALVAVNDAIYTNPGVLGQAGALELTEAWSVTASFEHFWTPTLRTSVTGQYIAIDYGQTATNIICTGLNAGTVGGGIQTTGFSGTCNPDGKIWQIASRTLWNPVANLDVGLEVAYTKIDSEIQGLANVIPGNGLAGGRYTLGDQEFWSANFRIQRNFWP